MIPFRRDASGPMRSWRVMLPAFFRRGLADRRAARLKGGLGGWKGPSLNSWLVFVQACCRFLGPRGATGRGSFAPAGLRHGSQRTSGAGILPMSRKGERRLSLTTT